MSVIIKRKEKQLAPEGMHPARCIIVADIGTQESKFGKNRKVILSFELSECKAVFKEENGEEPFVLSKTYNQSLDKKSSLVRDLTPWIGGGFAKRGACALGPLVLGKPCYVNVIHETKDTGETYATIIAISAIPKGTAAPEQILPSLEYSIEDGFNDVFEELPVWIQEKIKASDEVSGEGPTVAEITERNVRQATANALKEPHQPVGINEATSTDPDEDELNRELAAATAGGDSEGEES